MYRHNRKVIILLASSFAVQVISALVMKIVSDVASIRESGRVYNCEEVLTTNT